MNGSVLIYRSYRVDSVAEKQALATFYVEIIQKIIQGENSRQNKEAYW